MQFAIITDAACDLPLTLARQLDIIPVPMGVVIGGKEYESNIDERVLTFPEFYGMIGDGKTEAHTSAAVAFDFIAHMEPELKAGRDVLYLGFSSGLSATYNAGAQAADELRPKYPERKIFTVDTLCASSGEGLIIFLAAQERAKGKTIEEVRDFAESEKLNIVHDVIADDLHYLQRGGRVSASVAFVGSLLSFKPIITVSHEGKLVNIDKTRGFKNGVKLLIDRMAEQIVEPDGQTVFISHAHAQDKANELAAAIRERFPTIKEVITSYIGSLIGVHTGPGTVALFYRGKRPDVH
ncbi:MAG: DegV family protein [Oscillospiraceae bacterium]|jgi:DegV family protein with EDD domain|nr:DegV family protein [Oscillospiraceae bacterium]